MIGEQALERFARVLTSLIGMMQQRIRPAAPPQRHRQGVDDELRGHRRAHRPADDPPGEEVENDGDVKPAFRRPDVSEIRDPAPVRALRLELTVEDVAGDDGALAGVFRQAPPARPGLESMGAHQPLDAMQAAGKSFRQHVMPDAPRAVGAVAAFEAVANDPAEHGVASRTLALRPGEPCEESAPRNTERFAHPRHRPNPSVLRDEGELHAWSFAK